VGTIIGSIGSLIVGGIVAAVTITGLVTGQVNQSADRTGNIDAPVIDYGSTN